ncbi:RNA ligase family protein [Chamaesiphon sp. VAR_48_metabat_403]|uniref:RNA ligase family protein n=1 Tax=Chamaesiphon sp. VAR_48_metabat_403 TaxID=2964700 RepID=UPI00286D90ED|nr:RNA ligase family protein [Chamaesiphon sp. VAR_48_metabat_403]
MSTIKVEVCEILDLQPHGNADALELATVQGWQMCVKKGVHKKGDAVVYFEQGTVLKKEVAEGLNVATYLSEKTDINGDRVLVVHRIKLRGEPSFGLVVQPEAGMELGQDVAEFYQATKYNPPIKIQAGDSASDDPNFPKYTSLENMRSYPDLLEVGEPVIATEKVHGCLIYKTKISMWGGGHKPIHKIEIGEFVVGMNAKGEIVPSKVLKKFNNGSAEKWLNVRGKRRLFGGGNPFFSIYCTPSHQFYCPHEGCYKAAINLTNEDRVLIIHDSNSLTYVEEQILLGKLLGDGFLHKTKDSNSSAIKFSHKKSHEEYLNFCIDSLKQLKTNKTRNLTSGYGTEMTEASTEYSNAIYEEFYLSFRAEGTKKKVPSWVADRLSPLSLAFWYMDDGSLSHTEKQEDRALFACCNFSDADLIILLAGLKNLGLNGVSYKSDDRQYNRIRLNKESADKMFCLISPYIPEVMQYKLPSNYRGRKVPVIPATEQKYTPIIKSVDIYSVKEAFNVDSSRWDLETETHNFFANSILVHNSNCRVGYVWHTDDEQPTMMAGSRTLRRKDPEDSNTMVANTYWFPHTLPGVKHLLKELQSQGYKQAILYGEVYGQSIQAYSYGERKINFRAFDLMLEGKYVDYTTFKSLCDRHQVEQVPLVYEGAFSLDVIKSHSDGDSLVGGNHGREGVVVKPIVEREHPKTGRVILKYIGDRYLFGKVSEQDTTDI